MKQMFTGNVVSLFISQSGLSTRKMQQNIYLDSKGIIGDKFYGKDINRSVLITSTDSYNLAKKHNIDMSHGSLGENILVDHNPYHLSSGVQISMGTCILEISQNCTLCDHLSYIDKQLPTLLKHDRGIFAKVIQEGEIKENDKIFILD